MTIKVNANGTIECLYTEKVNLNSIGTTVDVKRASHVEWSQIRNGWVVDMSPVGGPDLGAYERRSDALMVEQEWMDENYF